MDDKTFVGCSIHDTGYSAILSSNQGEEKSHKATPSETATTANQYCSSLKVQDHHLECTHLPVFLKSQ